MYNIADFLLVQLSLSRFTLIKSAQSSHVCLNYIRTAQFYQSDDQNIRCHHNISHYSKANLQLSCTKLDLYPWTGRILSGWYLAEHFWWRFCL